MSTYGGAQKNSNRIGGSPVACPLQVYNPSDDFGAAAIYGAPSGAIVSGKMRAALQLPVPPARVMVQTEGPSLVVIATNPVGVTTPGATGVTVTVTSTEA